jgi:hypothetical protein
MHSRLKIQSRSGNCLKKALRFPEELLRHFIQSKQGDPVRWCSKVVVGDYWHHTIKLR